MSDGTFITQLAGHMAVPVQQTDDAGRKVHLMPAGWTARKCELPRVEPIALTTLTGLASYVLGDGGKATDLPPHDKLMAVVADPTEVRLVGHVGDEASNFRRMTWAEARPVDLCDFPFKHFMEPESFIIGLLSQFEDSSDRDGVVAMVQSIVDGAQVTIADDGVGQEVTTRRGAAFVNATRVPNPITLAPFRTFPEIDQPVSSFVLRMRSGRATGESPTLALFPADGGRWRLIATQRIAEWLAENMSAVVAVS